MHRFRNSVLLCLTLAMLVSASPSAAGPGWTGFRGPNSTGAVAGSLFERGTAGLAVGWKRELGSGYSSLAVVDGRVLAMFADGEDDVLGAFDAATGEEIWRQRIAETYAGHSGSHDGPISTPLVFDGKVVAFGPRGDLLAVKLDSGEKLWSTNVVEDHGAEAPFYGFTSAPVVLDGVIVLAIGSKEGKSIAGFDPKNGELMWGVGEDGVNFQSPIVTAVGGREFVLAANDKVLYGIVAKDGEVLFSWEHGGDQRAMGGATIVPLPAGEGRYLLMSKQDQSAMIKIAKNGEGALEVSELWSSNSISKSYVSPVYHDGYIYGINGRVLTCADAATGEIKWRSREPGDGFLSIVGDKLVVITKPGSLHVASLSTDGYEELASLELFDEHSWSEVAFADGHLFARSMSHLARVDVAAGVGSLGGRMGWVASTRFGAFLAEVESASDKNAVIDSYLDRQQSIPIVEGTDTVHFVFRGEATDVGIVGDMIGFRREDPMTHVEGTDLFYYSTRLEPDAAVTYGFITDYDEPKADPLNPHGADSLFGEVSWLAMPAWKAPRFVAEPEMQGTLETVEWEREVVEEVEGEEDKKTMVGYSAQIYLPAGFDASADVRYPTVYVHGGKEALEDGSMKNSLDNLIGTSVDPLIAVFIMGKSGEDQRPDPPPVYAEILTGTLIPMIDEKYPTIAEPSARASVGAGRAGSAALLSAVSHPEMFGRVASQSAVLFGVSLADMVKPADETPLTIYLDWGTYDLRSPHEAWDMAEMNRQAWALLRENGYRPAGGELPEGHGWTNWRARTEDVLVSLFPMGTN